MGRKGDTLYAMRLSHCLEFKNMSAQERVELLNHEFSEDASWMDEKKLTRRDVVPIRNAPITHEQV